MTTPTEQGSRKTLWTRAEAAKLTEMFPGARYELIEGELIDKMGQTPAHAYVIALLNTLLAAAFPGQIRIQSSVALPDPDGAHSEPEPDVVVLHEQSPDFFHRHPGPGDIALVIEVSDSTLQMDREIKARLYARCGIPVYWIVDIQQRRVLVFSSPGPEYKSIRIHEADESVVAGPVSIPIASYRESVRIAFHADTAVRRFRATL